MTTASHSSTKRQPSPWAKRGLGIGAIVVLLVAMGLDTTYVGHGESVGEATGGFSADTYGGQEFPKIQAAIRDRSAPAPVLAKALAADKDKAIAQYGIPGDIAPVLSVKFSGQVASCDSGICTVTVPDMPQDTTLRVQVGPAINGTALRDGIGGISFGDFKNQIEYQNAAASINEAMKKAVLADVDAEQLVGKTVQVVGAFPLIIDNNWLVTPVAFEVGL